MIPRTASKLALVLALFCAVAALGLPLLSDAEVQPSVADHNEHDVVARVEMSPARWTTRCLFGPAQSALWASLGRAVPGPSASLISWVLARSADEPTRLFPASEGVQSTVANELAIQAALRLQTALNNARTVSTSPPLASQHGLLLPPIEEPLVNSFGSIVRPNGQTTIRHPGQTYRASAGMTAESVAAGIVAWTGRLNGYGVAVVVEHSDDLFTIYGFLSESLVHQGQAVEAREALGRTGSDGPHAGTRLYFELRHQEVPVDPTGWFEADEVHHARLSDP